MRKPVQVGRAVAAPRPVRVEEEAGVCVWWGGWVGGLEERWVWRNDWGRVAGLGPLGREDLGEDTREDAPGTPIPVP